MILGALVAAVSMACNHPLGAGRAGASGGSGNDAAAGQSPAGASGPSEMGGVDGGCPATSSPSETHASIGPDVDVRVYCGQGVEVPIASVDVAGSGTATWSVRVAGDVAFRPVVKAMHTPDGPDPQVGANTFTVCRANTPEVASVVFPSANTPPGSFDAVATVHADDGSFADGTVKLHGEVVAPVVTLDKTTVDFGDVAPAAFAVADFQFKVQNGTGNGVYLTPDTGGAPLFTFEELNGSPDAGPTISSQTDAYVQDWRVYFAPNSPGDHFASVVWTASPGPGIQPFSSCNSTITMTLHARVVAAP